MFRSAALLILAFLASAATQAAVVSGDGNWIRGVYTGKSPRAISLEESVAWQRAGELVESTPGTFILVGTGHSMHPLYEPGTILVLQQLPFAELQRGQTALYRSKANKAVAHVLVSHARDGWRVQGLNNSTHDMEPIIADNLVGIVVAAFTPRPSRTALTTVATLR